MLYHPNSLRLRFLAWQEWLAIRYIDEQFVRFRQTKPLKPHPRFVWKGALLLLSLTALAAFPVLIIMPMLLLIFAASNFISGARLAAAAATTLATEYETGTYDLLAVTPQGTLYAGWQLAAGRVRRIRAYDSMRFYSRWLPGAMYVMGAVGTVVTTVLVLRDPFTTFTTDEAAVWTIAVIALLIGGLSVAYALYLDGVLSVVTATYTGIYAANFLREQATAQGVTAVIFIAVQMIIYVVMGLIAGVFFGIIGVLSYVWDELNFLFLNTVLYTPWMVLTGLVITVLAVVLPPITVGLAREAGVRLLVYLQQRRARHI
ncbi:MAG: hypothetical protein AAGK74_04275 [Chloroflexota bacterium]